jgi:hypothetical protein
MKSISLFSLAFIFCFQLFAQQAATLHPSDSLTLTVTFNNPPTSVSVEKAALRYNKDFAYSFILDDGLIDAYTAAFPLLNGGLVVGNNTIYPGYFYSDGCGNAIPFSAGLSWYSVNAAGNDLHVNTPSYVTWDQLKTMYQAGWTVLNHSYSHIANDTSINYVYQINQNTAYVKTKSGIDLSHFVPPAGDQNYVAPAFANGMLSVTGNNSSYNGFPDGYRIDQQVDLTNFKLFKMLISDANQNIGNIMQKIDTVAARSVNGKHYWWNDFTHHVGFTSSGASLLFPLFQFYMENIALQYGINGSDNIWMAPNQYVMEYINVRDKSILSYSLSGDELKIKINYSNVPDNMRVNALTLVVQSDQDFNSVDADGLQSLTYKGTGDNKLINLQWGDITTGIKEVEKGEGPTPDNIRIHPNPFIDKFYVDFDEAKPGNFCFELHDITGKKVFDKSVNLPEGKSAIEFDLHGTDLQPGIYILKTISGGKELTSQKVIKGTE